MLQQDRLLTLKEASAELGVHPNTLRNWGRAGLIRLAYLPGSRHRRVRMSEVNRLLEQMQAPPCGAPAGSVQSGSRQHPGPRPSGEVSLRPPPADPAAVAEGEALAAAIKRLLADQSSAAQGETVEEVMGGLRGRSWSS